MAGSCVHLLASANLLENLIPSQFACSPGPKAAREILDLRPEVADTAFGLTSLVAGALGTLAGGAVLDAIGSSLRNALLLCAGAVFTGSLFLAGSFLLAPGVPLFFSGLATGELLLFSIGVRAGVAVFVAR